LRGRRPDERQAERHHGKAVKPKSPDPPHRIFLPSLSGVGRRCRTPPGASRKPPGTITAQGNDGNPGVSAGTELAT